MFFCGEKVVKATTLRLEMGKIDGKNSDHGVDLAEQSGLQGEGFC